MILASYQYHVSFSSNGQSLVDDNCQLDVARSKSYFHSLGLEENIKKMATKAALSEKTGQAATLSSKDFKKDILKYYSVKNYRTKEAIIVERIQTQQLGIVKDTLSAKGWSITNEKKTINGLNCTKATRKKDGITAIAWFAPSIPIQEGPFYFSGLPGLIIHLTTSLGWEAQLIKVIHNSAQPEMLRIPRYTMVSINQLEKAKKNARELAKQGIFTNGDKVEKANN